MKHQLLIKRDGTIQWLTPPPFTIPGPRFKKRFSTITPVNPVLHFAFWILRLCFGEKGRVAAWTRRWRVLWRMKVLSTGYTELGRDRAALIEREHELFFFPLGEL